VSYITFLTRRYASGGRKSGFVSFITSVAIIGVMLGTLALNISLSVIAGFEKQLQANVVALTAEIEVRGFQRKPLTNYIAATKFMHDSIPGIRAIAPFAMREAIIKSRTSIEGIMLKGIDSAHDLTNINNHIVAGAFRLNSAAGALPTIIIGKRLAEKLLVSAGDSLVIFTLDGVPSPMNPARVDKAVIAGLYETGFGDFDDLFVYTGLASAQKMLALPPGSVSGFNIMAAQPDSIASVAANIESIMGYPYYALTMYDMYPNIFAWIELQKKPIPIVLGLIVIVAAFNIVATMLMIVLEKTHTIGILKTLGATAGDVRRLFLTQGIVISSLGVALGDAFGWALCAIQQTYHVVTLKSDIYFMSWAPIDMHLSMFVLVSIIALALGLAATYIPARIASRLLPLQALRFG